MPKFIEINPNRKNHGFYHPWKKLQFASTTGNKIFVFVYKLWGWWIVLQCFANLSLPQFVVFIEIDLYGFAKNDSTLFNGPIKIFVNIFDCCKQSLTRYFYIHPPTHPSFQQGFFYNLFILNSLKIFKSKFSKQIINIFFFKFYFNCKIDNFL